MEEKKVFLRILSKKWISNSRCRTVSIYSLTTSGYPLLWIPIFEPMVVPTATRRLAAYTRGST
jgi:hypothetical protein